MKNISFFTTSSISHIFSLWDDYGPQLAAHTDLPSGWNVRVALVSQVKFPLKMQLAEEEREGR